MGLWLRIWVHLRLWWACYPRRFPLLWEEGEQVLKIDQSGAHGGWHNGLRTISGLARFYDEEVLANCYGVLLCCEKFNNFA